MKLIIVRHGETDHNKTRTHMGQLDIPLNNLGHQQAKLVGQRLATEKISAIYSSDLRRAKLTAQSIALHHPKLNIMYDPLLRERHVGILEGQPIQLKGMIRKGGGQVDRFHRPPNGESIHDVKLRAKEWYEKIRTQHEHDTIVVVGHGLYLYVLLELAIEDGADGNREDFILDNTSVTVLEVPKNGRAQVIHLNDTTHLQA